MSGVPDGARRAAIEAVFDEALDVPPADRAGWLEARCGDDRALRAEVEALLAADAEAEAPLDTLRAPIAALAASAADAPRERRIGPYRVVRELGRGGQGVVYLAERDDGQFQRQVAVKLLLASRDAEELRRRFLAERQILASLSHPHIAQLLDGGAAEGALPYLVMEYVDGEPITAYCDRVGLPLEGRLALFRDVCSAVQHAHRNLVLHRDLKPGNILVTADGMVKLLDFGIAKLLAPEGTSMPATRTAARPMTPAYASPEQVRGDVLTTASDVYALGLILYELLTGTHAYDVDGVGPAEAFRRICEVEPPPPSRAATPWAPALRGDLDAIVMMALRKEPGRRYGSPELLVEDLERHAQGLPVHAHRGSTWYRVRKMVRRHRVAVTAAALVTASLAGGLWAARVQATVAEEARAEAEDARRQSEAMSAFLVSLFEARRPEEGRRDSLTANDLLRRGAARAAQHETEPLVQARMFDALGRVHMSLGDLTASEDYARRALLLRRLAAGPAHPLTADAMVQLAEVERRRGAYRLADSLARGALAIRRAAYGQDHPSVAESLRQVAGLAVYLGDLRAAVALSAEAVEVRRRSSPASDTLLIGDLETLASTLWRRGETVRAIEVTREALAIARRQHRAPHPNAAAMQLLLADRLSELPSPPPEARTLAEDGLREMRAALGPQHPRTAEAMRTVGWIAQREGDLAAAEALHRAAFAVSRAVLGPDDVLHGWSLAAIAGVVADRGRLDEAVALQRAALPYFAHTYGESHSAYAGAIGDLGDLILRRGGPGAADSAQALHERAVAIRLRALGPESVLIAITELGLARVATARGDTAAADSIYADALARMRPRVTDAHPDVRRILAARAALRR